MASREYQKGFLNAVRYLRIRVHAADGKPLNYELDRAILDAEHGIFPDADAVTIADASDSVAKIADGTAELSSAPAPVTRVRPNVGADKPKRTRRTSAQIATDRAAAAASKAQQAAQ